MLLTSNFRVKPVIEKRPQGSGDNPATRRPRERILTAARELFSTQGIRAVSVEAIADRAGSNKMTLYRHFESKDALVAEYLRLLSEEANTLWGVLDSRHPGDPRAQLLAWVSAMTEHSGTRGCPLANAAVELPERGHPARCVIEGHKRFTRDQLVRLCRDLGAQGPEFLADQIFLLIEGARVTCQSVGPSGPGANVLQMAEALIDAQVDGKPAHR